MNSNSLQNLARLALFLCLLIGPPQVAESQLGTASILVVANSESRLEGLSTLTVDLDGDGYEDVVVGRAAGVAHGGSIVVFHGGPCGLELSVGYIQENFGFVTSDGDQFGRSLAAGHFNDDSFIDLAIGIPGQNVSGQNDAGAVLVVYGEEGGLNVGATAVFSQANLEGAVEEGDSFGSTLTVGDFDLNGTR